MADSAESTENTETTEEAGSAEETGGENTAGKTFTESDVNAIVEARLARERKKTADYGDLKKKAEAFEKLEAEKLSDLEKANARAEEAEKKAQEASERLKATSLRSAVVEVASDAAVVDSKAVADFLLGTDSDLLDVDDDGEPTNTADAVEALLERRPYLAGQPPKAKTPSADQGARGTVAQLTEADLKSMSPHEIVQARKEGRLANLTGG